MSIWYHIPFLLILWLQFNKSWGIQTQLQGGYAYLILGIDYCRENVKTAILCYNSETAQTVSGVSYQVSSLLSSGNNLKTSTVNVCSDHKYG